MIETNLETENEPVDLPKPMQNCEKLFLNSGKLIKIYSSLRTFEGSLSLVTALEKRALKFSKNDLSSLFSLFFICKNILLI